MFAVAVTFPPWLEALRASHQGREVNFWTPTDWKMRKLVPGDRVYFMLKSPFRQIGGYGEFAAYEMRSPDDAWSRFNEGNGVTGKAELVERVRQFADKQGASTAQPDQIGCMVLTNFVGLEQEDYLAIEDAGLEFSRNIVKFRYFDLADDPLATVIGAASRGGEFKLVVGDAEHSTATRKRREGQAAFRAMVLAAYGNRCAATGVNVSTILEAAHIQPFVDQRSNHVQNGIALRRDVHRLFDERMLWVDADGTWAASPRLANTAYQKLAGRRLRVPKDPLLRPSALALSVHRSIIPHGA